MLALTDLHKQYGDVAALSGCTFQVDRGRMLGFLGPNGAGKTTAMRTIFGLVTADSGQVTWDGEPITMEQKRRFGYMPEQRGLYPKMKAHDQLTYLGRLRGMEQKEAAASADRWLERFGLAERRLDRVEVLSHGNQQRVQLAAALVHDPELLVLDEPFSGLDPIATETMADILREETAKGKAVVFSSHQLDLVEDICEEVAIINAGRIVVEGNVRRLKDAAPIRHLELELDGEVGDLFDTLEDVRQIRSADGSHTLIIDAGSDIRGFLARAQQVGRVRHFTYTSPSLSDLFREAVR
ncbi:MAG TPA: ATP-binding cassette domain-containing protein [Acidimicrobiia bacterium]|nr:ATP-binding cassette domain-containing protein [Acidimicrobiia bacterium]